MRRSKEESKRIRESQISAGKMLAHMFQEKFKDYEDFKEVFEAIEYVFSEESKTMSDKEVNEEFKYLLRLCCLLR